MPLLKKRLAVLATLLLVSGVCLWKVRYTTPHVAIQTLGEGVTLETIEANRLSGAIQMRVVRADFNSGWRLGVVPASSNVLQRKSVPVIAGQVNAPVAVNGGFFAYDGAAVGPLVLQNEWIRLPWKNRTAIGFSADGRAKIDNLKASAQVVFEKGVRVTFNNLNGAAPKNGVAVLTPHLSVNYQLKPNEMAMVVGSGVVSSVTEVGKVAIPSRGFAVVAQGDARTMLRGVGVGEKGKIEVKTFPDDWRQYPTILGAGPRLIKGGRVQTTEVDEEFKPDVTAPGPRTAVGMDKDGNWILVVVSGWQGQFQGITIPELAREMQQLGAVEALNLDGGASISMAVNGQVLVKSTDSDIPVANAVVLLKEKTLQ